MDLAWLVSQTLAIVVFVGGVALRIESRITRLETKIENLERMMDGFTG
jgi:hypothetical protein